MVIEKTAQGLADGRSNKRKQAKGDTRRTRWGTFCMALCLLACTKSISAQELDGTAVVSALQQTIFEVVEKSEASVVSIARMRISNGIRREFSFDRIQGPQVIQPRRADPLNDPDYIPNDFGSGIVLGEIRVDGNMVTAILTNYHVVKGGETSTGQTTPTSRLSVRYAGEPNGKPGTIWAADPRSDLAIITIPARGLQPIKIAAAGEYRKGQIVFVLGNPYAMAHEGGSASISWGMISNIGRRANSEIANLDGTTPGGRGVEGNEHLYHLGGLLQVDARLNLGMSGGALVNQNGELIGVTTSLAALAGYEKSAGYAIPIDETVQRVIKTLLKGQEVEYGFLGVSLPQQPIGRTNVEGVFISGAIENLPAYEGGIVRDDIITAIDDIPISTQRDLMREIGKLAPGTEVKLTVVRQNDRRPRKKTVVLGKWPAKNEDQIIAPVRRYGGVWRGMVVDFSSGRFRFLPKTSYDAPPPRGVLVSEVEPGSPAAANQLKPGDFVGRVNGRVVRSPQEFHRAVESIDGPVKLTVIRGTDQHEVEVDVD